MWRGTARHNPLREKLIAVHRNTPNCDIEGTNRRTEKFEGSQPKISLESQLRNKFLISLEGIDVATNLKWIMNSNSLCFMPKPRRESWFLESWPKQGEHYVELADDFSNLEEKIDYFFSCSSEAEDIVANAQAYCRNFKNFHREEALGILVAARYFHFCQEANFNHAALQPH